MDTVPSEVPKGYHPLRYQTKVYDENTKSLSTFTQDERDFLEQYRLLHQVLEFFKPEDPFCVMNIAEAEREAEQKFWNFKLDNERIRCPDTGTLHTVIPYVKPLFQIFPQLKGYIKVKLSSPEMQKLVHIVGLLLERLK